MHPLIEYIPGILLVISALLGLRSLFAALRQAQKTGDKSGGNLRLFIFSSLGNLGALLIGASILLDKLNHPWKTNLGFFGSVLIIFALVRRIANAAADYLRKRFPPGRRDMGIGTLLGWIAGTSTGSFVGYLLTLALLLVASEWLGPLHSWSSWMKVIMRAAVGAMSGLLIGVFQLRVLNPYLPESRRWIWATIAGLAIAYGVYEMIASDSRLESREGAARAWRELISRAITGGLLGMFQWRVLERWSLRAGWWPVFCALAADVGFVVIELLLPRPLRGQIFGYLARVLVSDIAESMVTGVGLLWLQKARVSPNSFSSVPTAPYQANRPT